MPTQSKKTAKVKNSGSKSAPLEKPSAKPADQISIKLVDSAQELERVREIASRLFSNPVLPESGRHVYFIAKQGGRAIGFSHLILRQSATRKSAVMQGLGVEREFQGGGIGTMLVDESLDWCIKRGITSVILKVKATNDLALRLYLKSGFQQQFIGNAIVMQYKPPN